MTEDQEPMVHFPVEKWGELQNAFKADWPRGLLGFAILEVQKRWKKHSIDFNFTVYCPFGDISNGLFAVNVKNSFYEIVVLCPKDDTRKLEEALEKTKLIDWNQEVCVPYAPHNVVKCLLNLIPRIGMELTKTIELETFILEKAAFEDVCLPPNMTFGPITQDNLALVDSTWRFRYSSSPWYFQLLMNANCSHGLYLDNNLISWVFFKESGCLLHLFTIEEHRSKGYAELLLKLVSNVRLNDGIPVFAFCLKDNYNACKLYRKIGFVQTKPITWCFLNKKIK